MNQHHVYQTDRKIDNFKSPAKKQRVVLIKRPSFQYVQSVVPVISKECSKICDLNNSETLRNSQPVSVDDSISSSATETNGVPIDVNISSQSSQSIAVLPDCSSLSLCSSRLDVGTDVEIEHALVCEVCDKSFDSNQSLAEHKCVERVLHHCRKCGKTFQQNHALLRHQFLQHNAKQISIRKYICSVCGLDFKYAKQFRHHQLEHEGNQFTCELCSDLTFSKYSSYRSHLKQYHTKIECRICSAVCIGSSSYLEHSKLFHSEDDSSLQEIDQAIKSELQQIQNEDCRSEELHTSHLCDTCGKSFRRRAILLRHQFVQHNLTNPEGIGMKDYQCSTCGKVLKYREQFRQHKLEHDGHLYHCTACPDPPSPFNKYSLFKNHQIKHHNKIKCKLCGEKSIGRLGYAEHIRLSHPTEQVETIIYSKKINCPKCNSAFRTARELEEHDRSKHLGLLLSCPLCAKHLSTSHCLKLHMRTHGVGALHKCEYCQQTFPQKGHMIQHIRTAHPENMPKGYPTHFACSLCNKTFRNSYSLVKHTESKHEGITYQCPDCEKPFRSRSGVYHHKRQCPGVMGVQ